MAKRYSNLNPFKSLAYLKVSNSTKAQKHKSYTNPFSESALKSISRPE